MCLSDQVRTRAVELLTPLYGDTAPACLDGIVSLAESYRETIARHPHLPWHERDVVLITYGDQVRSPGQSPLAALARFLARHRLHELVSTVHLLPFFPSTSDDGFSVSDYRQVDPDIGSWQDIARLVSSFELMFDLVLNHCSAQHRWFQEYLAGRTPYDEYFLACEPSAELAQVTRPRTTPLCTAVETASGPRRVWTTFSADQIDLNWASPHVLLEMLDTLLFYVLRGARIIRLDAIAYLWKRPGTTCIHLPETHAVVKLIRLLLDAVAPGTWLLTETNVPHRENVSYFGAGDEAQMVYQFSLPPLLLDAFVSGDARVLMQWLARLTPAAPGTTYFNFTASHDGVGLRPLEDLLPPARIAALIEAMRARGAAASLRRTPDGRDQVYELNVSYFSALSDPQQPDTATHVRRFLASQAVMLALRGIPGIYFHSLVGTPNALDNVRQTGRPRSINRHKFQWDELESILATSDHPSRQVFAGYCGLLSVRRQQPAFHPDAAQDVVPLHPDAVISFVRSSTTTGQQILCATNVSDVTVTLDLPGQFARQHASELLWSGANWQSGTRLTLLPAGTIWLSNA